MSREPEWRKSSFSASQCVEVAALPDDRVGVRNSKDPEGPVLAYSKDEWVAFIKGAQAGDFDNLA